MRQQGYISLVIYIWLLAISGSARAEGSPFDAWAQWVTSRQGKWKGQLVPYPDQVPRPEPQPLVLDSWLLPVSVHAPARISMAEAERVLSHLERAYELLLETGWPIPLPDGGAGGTAGFDLYYLPSSSAPAEVYLDSPVTWSLLDDATAYAVVDSRVDKELLQACIVSALAQAALLGQDPAEAPAWRQATGAFVAWLATGYFGCDDAVVRQQQEPWRGWITDAPESGAGGALFLAMLSEVQDGGTGSFIRELWQFARQSTEPGDQLRGSPDLYEAMARALKNAGQSLDEIAVDLAVARYFAGPDERRRAAPYKALRWLPLEAAVPVVQAGGLGDLPRHLPEADPPIETFGSSYAMVDTLGAVLPGQLKIWLRGEHGALWSLVAVRLATDGQEIGRVAAPSKPDPNSYLSVELTADTAKVLIVVTNLIDGTPDADCDTRNSRSFRLILDSSR